MELFIKKPNLPQGSVRTALLGSAYPNIADALTEIGITPICLPDNNDISNPVRAHADMSAYYCGNGKLILSQNIVGKCRPEMFPQNTILAVSANCQSEKYPFDITLNACEIGEYIFCKKDCIDSKILSHAVNCDKKIINTHQGYSKCSVCILDEKHIITSDSSIASNAVSVGIDVLLISPGFFELSGYNYGFIGGCSFKISNDTIAFTGILSGHPDEKRIMQYIESLGLKAIFLTKERCFDIGSVIPLTEER